MKLQELKTAGIIPDSLSDNSFLFICTNKLGIGKHGIDMNFEINEEQFQKILYSADINNYKIKSEMQIQHNSVIERYNELIDRYKQLVATIQANPNFAGERVALTNLINNLESERNTYKSTVAGFSAKNVDKYFDFDESKTALSGQIIETSKKLAESTQKQVNTADKELNKAYAKFANLESRKPKSIVGKINRAMKMNSLKGRINKLRNKTGRLQTIQRTILESRTNAYVNKMNKKFDKYIMEQDKIIEAIDNKKELIDDIKSYENEKSFADSDYNEAQVDKVNARGLGKIGAAIRERNSSKYKKYMETKLIALNSKLGSVNISQQFNTTFTRSYAR